MNYYDLDYYISNSNLTSFDNAVNGIEQPASLTRIFAEGTLLDTMVTQEDKVSKDTLSCLDEQGERLYFDTATFGTISNMCYYAKLDSLLNLMLLSDKTKLQYVFLRNAFEVNYCGDRIFIPMRCKFDLYCKGHDETFGLDIKGTSCTSRNSFIASMDLFDYDRQAALYMDLSKTDKIVFLAVSKKTNKRGGHDVFKVAIERGDSVYLSGLQKYSRLAFKYHYLIYNLNVKGHEHQKLAS